MPPASTSRLACPCDGSGLRPGMSLAVSALATPTLVALALMALAALATPALAVPTLAALPHPHDAGAAVLAATADPATIANLDLDHTVFVDTRDVATCANGSVDGALCMVPGELLHPDGSPASFRGINWLAGTFGLDPAATAVVFGDDRTDAEFVAGMLFLLGQSRVVIWRGGTHSMLDSMEPGPGRRRGTLRSLYYARPVRDGYIALDGDVRRFLGSGAGFGSGSGFGVGSRFGSNPGPGSGPSSGSGSGFGSSPGSGPGSEAPLRERDADASVYRRDDDGALLVLAPGAREAVAGFARVLLAHPSAPALVHIDGLRERTAESLGAPREGSVRNVAVVVAVAVAIAVSLGIALLLRAALAGRRRAMAGLR